MVAFNTPAPHNPIRFPLGQTCGTPAALQALAEAGQAIDDLLRRHQAGDWGEVGAEDREQNEQAVDDEGRLMSVYTLGTGVTTWVITEADRSVTTVLLPDDY
jgi:hypothetical protein